MWTGMCAEEWRWKVVDDGDGVNGGYRWLWVASGSCWWLLVMLEVKAAGGRWW